MKDSKGQMAIINLGMICNKFFLSEQSAKLLNKIKQLVDWFN